MCLRRASCCLAMFFLAAGHLMAEPLSISEELDLAKSVRDYNARQYDRALERLNAPEFQENLVARYYSGLAALASGRGTEAVEELKYVSGLSNAPAEAYLDLGAAQLAAGDGEGAVTSLTTFESIQPTNSTGQILLAMALKQTGRGGEASARFQVAAGDPSFRGLALGFLSPPSQPMLPGSPASYPVQCAPHVCQTKSAADKWWNLTLLTGYQYDSNVTLAPEFVGLGSGQDIRDSSAIVALFGDVRLFDRDTWNLGLVTSAFGTFHDEATQFDVQDYMGGVYSNRIIAPNLMAGIRYEFHSTQLDYQLFSSQHRIAPNITRLMGDLGHLTAYYEFENQQFEDPGLIQALDRDSNINALGLTQAFYTGNGDGRLFFGYRYEEADADGNDFDRATHMANVRVEKPLNDCLIVDAGYRHFWDNYDDPNNLDFAGRRRVDRRNEVRAGIQFTKSASESIRVDYTFIDSESNVQNLFGVNFFEYDRHLVSVQYVIDF